MSLIKLVVAVRLGFKMENWSIDNIPLISRFNKLVNYTWNKDYSSSQHPLTTSWRIYWKGIIPSNTVNYKCNKDYTISSQHLLTSWGIYCKRIIPSNVRSQLEQY